MAAFDGANWTNAFQNFSHQMDIKSAVLDDGKRLRVTFSYSEDLQDQNVSADVDFSLSSNSFNMSAIRLSFPSSTSDNEALYYYEDSSYAMAKGVEYLSIGIAAISVLLFFLGYFGCKLQTIECIAVVQLAALLVLTIENMSPTFEGLQKLQYSLGLSSAITQQ